jgi:serine/threonine protein kinase/tetratricopeptide (TPR) repeat protein
MKDAAVVEEASMESVVGRLAEEYTERINSGEGPEVGEYVKRYPQFAEQIRQILAALEAVRTLTSEQAGPRGVPDAAHPVAGQLGDYRILREVGRGGMGVVYEAKQVSLGRKVALKVLPFAAVLDQRQLQRFKNEAQAAAQLHHQNIVPVYSVGCERGVHYYAMQYIEGQTLASVIAELRHVSDPGAVESEESRRSLSEQTRSLASGRWAPAEKGSSEGAGIPAAPTRPSDGSSGAAQALASEYSTQSAAYFRSVSRLGIQAAEALDHAHESGVLHRDVKPSNLLLDVGGHLWITDFGLAHVESDPGLTMTGDILGTVRYMSPEQALARRIPVDHRTDIYSLGVTLYELLTLKPAFTGRDRQALLRQIAFDEPRLPRRVNPAIPTELETIVLKSVSKNPEQRYATAQELADDLERFLEDKPIRAKRPGLIERATKWSRRHRAVVASGVVLLVMAVIALSVSTVLIWQAQARTQAALDQVQEQSQRAMDNFLRAREAIDRMLTQVTGELPTPLQPTRPVGAGKWRPDLDSPEPTIPTERVRFIPQVDEIKRAILDDALEYYHWLLQERSVDPSIRFDAAMYQDLGSAQWSLGVFYRGRGNFTASERAFEQAIDVYDRLARDSPDEPTFRGDLAASYRDFGYLLEEFGRLEEAEVAFDHAVELDESLTHELPAAPQYQTRLVHSYLGVGSVLRRLARFQEAEEVIRKAADLQADLANRFPNNAEQRSLILCHRWLNQLLAESGRFETAVAAFRSTIAMAHGLIDQFPNEPDYRLALAGTHQDLAEMLCDAGRLEEAETTYRRAEAVADELCSEFNENSEYSAVRYSIRSGLSAVLRKRGHVHEADEIYRELLGRWGSLGAELVILGKRSVEGVAEAVELARRTDTHTTAIEPYSRLILGAYLLLGDHPQGAVEVIQRAIEDSGYKVRKATVHWYYFHLGRALLSAGRADEARAAFNRALDGFETWAPTPSVRAMPDQWSAAYFLDLVSREQYTRRWENSSAITVQLDCMPWFYVGQRAEIEGRIEDAISAYQRAVELGEQSIRIPDMTAHFAAYRLQVLTGDRDEGGQRASDELSETVEE